MTQPDFRPDLHSHSRASDGALTPAALVDCAAEAGVTALALTDHDTVAGLPRARAQAARKGLQLINGVEISVSWQKRTLHIVGLGIDPDSPALLTGLGRLQAAREERAQRIAARLDQSGMDNALAKAQALAGHRQITRTHFAQLLVAQGLCKDMKQAFKRHLGAGKPAYVPAQWAELEDAIDWIHQAGGLAVLAHPMLYNMSAAWRQRMYLAFSEAGGDGMEICCGHSNPQQIQQSTREALQYELMGSVGSDFHSHEQRWLGLGRVAPLPASITPVWSHPQFRARLQ